MIEVVCPACGSDELRGAEADDGIDVTCSSCGHAWQRDVTPTCRACGSTDLVVVLTSTLEEAGRGDQRTPSGVREVHHCSACGARDATSSSPLPPLPRPGPIARQERRTQQDQPATPTPQHQPEHIASAFGTFAVGEVIGGRWRLQRLLHRSSTGTLWVAVSVDETRHVVFKLVDPESLPDLDPSAWQAAAAATSKVTHPGLLRVHGAKRQGRDVLVVADHVDGKILEALARLDGDPLTRMPAQASAALAAMHARRVVHLGIRPGKILLGDDGHARLIDLGADRVRAGQRRHPALDRHTAWQAPEQIVAKEHDLPADVYGLGLTFWHAVGGRLDVLGPTASAQALARVEDELPPIRDLVPNVPPRLAEAISLACRRRPVDRPTASELAGLLTAPV